MHCLLLWATPGCQNELLLRHRIPEGLPASQDAIAILPPASQNGHACYKPVRLMHARRSLEAHKSQRLTSCSLNMALDITNIMLGR